MILCNKCWKIECNCSRSKINIDDSIVDTIRILNLKGYETRYCCGGHISKENILLGLLPSIYIVFNKYNCKDIIPFEIGDGWILRKTEYVLEYTLNEAKKYKNKGQILTEDTLYDLENILQSKRDELNLWANNL